MSRYRIALAAVASLLAFGAQAQSGFNAPLTREQVRAEYMQARDAGRLAPSGEVGHVAQVSKSRGGVTRGEVLRDLAANGPQDTAEGSDLGNSRSALSTRSRAEVHAEAKQAVRDGAQGGGKL